MLNRWFTNLIVGFVLSFIMRQLEKWRNNIDWALVRVDVEARVRALVPGTWMDDQAVAFVMSIIDAAESALSATADIERILKLAADQKWQEALVALRDLIIGHWSPATAAEQYAYDCVKCYEPVA